MKKVYTSKTYRLKKHPVPISYTLANRHTRYKNLLYFDASKGVNRQLRYSRNQRSPFVDEQDGNVIIESIVFNDGLLHVVKENQVLQEFLYYHPSRDKVFEEVNEERDARKEYEQMEEVLNAQIIAKELSLEKLESVSRILLGEAADKMSTAELKRDILVFSMHDPKTFVEIVNDPELEFQDEVRKFFNNKLLTFRNKNKDIYYNIPGNKKKMLTVPFNADPYHIVETFLKSDEGVEVYKGLKKVLDS